MSSNTLSLPRPEEIEISVFGPGYGECIVMHLGTGKWIIIDSCITTPAKTPAALDYFEKIGLNPSDAVEAIVVSHWHDDHIRGLSDIVDACPSAIIACPSALLDTNFTILLELYANSEITDSGLSEFEKIMLVLQRTTGRACYASTEKRLIKGTSDKTNGISCEVICISPLDDALTQARAKFANFISTPKASQRRMPSPSQNDCSVALKITGGGYSFLLGSDLENCATLGWGALIQKLSKEDKSLLLKVPHHGAKSAHHDGIWNDLLLPDNPYALISPFIKGNQKLPTEADIDRIKSFTSNAFITADIELKQKAKKLNNTAEKFLAQTVKSRKPAQLPTGHIRFRIDINTDVVTVDLFNGAKPL